MNDKFYALPQEKQDKIWNAAIKIFSTCNYKSASTIEIAKEAGISKALLFHYFTNKKELYLSVNNYCMSYMMNELKKNAQDTEHDFFQILLRSQNCKCEIMIKYPYLFEFLIKAYMEEEPDIRQELEQLQKPIVDQSLSEFLKTVDKSKIKEDVDLAQLLKMIVWCSDGCMREYFRRPIIDPYEINKEFSQVLMMLKRFIYKESMK